MKAIKTGLVKTVVYFAVMMFALIMVFLLSIATGTADMTVKTVLDVLTGNIPEHSKFALIIYKIRLPRVCATILGGSAIAVSGLLLQTFFSNPIVEPYILGITSGSSLFVALILLGGFTLGMAYVTPLVLFIGAFLGAMTVMTVVIFAARRTKSILTLLIIGIMAGYICSSATNILTAFAEKEAIANFSMWTMGSFAGFTMSNIQLLATIVVPFLGMSYLLSKNLNALKLGDRYAISMGVNVRFLRYAIIFISSVLTAAVTAFAGPVSFIGLAVPHICRIIFFTSDTRVLIPASILGGALMLSLCDFIARNVIAPVELPLGAITSIIGAPIVVYLLVSRRSK